MGKITDIMDVWLGIAEEKELSVSDVYIRHPMKNPADYLANKPPKFKTFWHEYEPRPREPKKVKLRKEEKTVSIYEMLRTERMLARQDVEFTNGLKMDMAKVRKYNREVLI